jgi:hypothetical protein
MAKRTTSPAEISVPHGDRAQIEQMHQSLARVATKAATEAATRAAKETLNGFFLTIGFDITEPKEIQRLQKTFTFASDMMVARDTIRRKTLSTLVVLVVTGLGTLLAIGVRNWIKLPSVALAAMMLATTPAPADAHWKPEYASAPPRGAGLVRQGGDDARIAAAAALRFMLRS